MMFCLGSMCTGNLFVHIQGTKNCLAYFTGHSSLMGESPLRSVPFTRSALSTINKDLIPMKIEFLGANEFRRRKTSILCPASELYRLAALMSTMALTGGWEGGGHRYYEKCRMSLTLCDTYYLSPLIVSDRLLNPFNHIFKADQTWMYRINLSRRTRSAYRRARDEAPLVHGDTQSIADQWLKHLTRAFNEANALYAQPTVIVAAKERFAEVEDLSIWLIEARPPLPELRDHLPLFTDEQLLSIHRMASLAKQGTILSRYDLLFVQEPGEHERESNMCQATARTAHRLVKHVSLPNLVRA